MLGGLYLRFGNTLERATKERVQRTAQAVLAAPHPALTDVIPGYSTLYLEYDTARSSEHELQAWLQGLPEGTLPEGKRHVLEVVYDGPDVAAVADHTGLNVSEVVARHSARDYDVYAVGFTPGLALMGPLEPALQVPRRPAPRPRVEAGTVAITGAQTTVYPVASPGGWQLLGRTVRHVYEPGSGPLFSPGDRVRFRPVAAGARLGPQKPLELLPGSPRYPLLRVLETGLLDLIVDRGRFFAGRFGFARGGPLDRVAAGVANRLVGNPPGGALLELNVQGGLYEVAGHGVVAFAGGGLRAVLNGEKISPNSSFAVRPGDRLGFKPVSQGSRGYLAFAGGLETRRHLGSASVDLRGGMGRALAAGDVLGVAEPHAIKPGRTFQPDHLLDPERWPLRFVPGPQATAAALGALTRQTFTVGRADRMGVQLTGASVPGGEVLSEAVPLGSVQVPPGGTPLLLLHDRGTLGGYAKPAVLHPADLPRAGQVRPGQRVRFRLAD